MRLVVLSVHGPKISTAWENIAQIYLQYLMLLFTSLHCTLRLMPVSVSIVSNMNYVHNHSQLNVTISMQAHPSPRPTTTIRPSALYLYTVPSVHCVISPDILGASTLVCVSSLPHTCVCLTIVLSQYHALLRLLKKRKRTEQRIGRLQEPAVFCSLKKLTLPNASFSNLWASHIMLNSNFGQKWHSP